MVKMLANAKINLALEVMDEKDGYHMVNNIMIPISLYDEIIVTKAEEISVSNCDIENNICVKAANLFLEHFKISTGALITLNKHIPVAAGLAGGSTDGAYTLLALDKLYKTNASIEELKSLASLLGSDVPFFIENKVSLCTNRGEIVTPLNIDSPRIRLLLLKPNTGLSTALVYKNYHYDGISKADKLERIVKALKEKDIALLDANIFNDLEPVALKINPDLALIYNDLKKDYNVHVSGSGPSMFIINPSDDDILKIKNKYTDIFISECYTI